MMKRIIVLLSFLMLGSACQFDTAGLNQESNNHTNNNEVCSGVDCGNGECIVDDATSFHCECDERWTGDLCNQCDAGYTGENCTACATDFIKLNDDSCIADPCENDTCSGNGECGVDLEDGSPLCVCDEGYSGNSCTECATDYIEYPEESGQCVIDQCIGVDCGDHGQCMMPDSQSAACQCDEGYIGEFCENCDESNGYIDHDGNCELDPCYNYDCGGGTCVRDASWLPVCNCTYPEWGEHCQIDLSQVLVYQSNDSEVSIQVHGIWDYISSDFRVVLDGSNTGVSVIYYQQSDIDSNGWQKLYPCAPGVSESIRFWIVESPYDAVDWMQFPNNPDPNTEDPHQIIYTSNQGENMLRGACQCNAGECIFSPNGN